MSNKSSWRSLWPDKKLQDSAFVRCLTSERFYSVTSRNVNEIYIYIRKRTKMHCMGFFPPLSSFKTSFNYHLSYSSVKNLGSLLKRTLEESWFLPQIILTYRPESARNTTCNLIFVCWIGMLISNLLLFSAETVHLN